MFFYVAERADEKLHRSSTIRMGIRIVQRTNIPRLPSDAHTCGLSTHLTDDEQKKKIIDDGNKIVECEGMNCGSTWYPSIFFFFFIIVK